MNSIEATLERCQEQLRWQPPRPEPNQLGSWFCGGERFWGRAHVINTFTIPSIGTMAGCHQERGHTTDVAIIRVFRNSTVMYEGPVMSLWIGTQAVEKVGPLQEFGLTAEGVKFHVGDVIESYR